jgi:hypothetical protein
MTTPLYQYKIHGSNETFYSSVPVRPGDIIGGRVVREAYGCRIRNQTLNQPAGGVFVRAFEIVEHTEVG